MKDFQDAVFERELPINLFVRRAKPHPPYDKEEPLVLSDTRDSTFGGEEYWLPDQIADEAESGDRVFIYSRAEGGIQVSLWKEVDHVPMSLTNDEG